MPTNLALEDTLIDEARRLGNHKSKKESVIAALEEYARRRKQLEILDPFGTIDYDPEYDYKKIRHVTEDRVSSLSPLVPHPLSPSVP